MKRRLLAVTAATAALAFLSSAAEAASPLRARVARCTPISLGDSQGGVGGTPDKRKVGIDFGLFTVAADDSVPLDALGGDDPAGGVLDARQRPATLPTAIAPARRSRTGRRATRCVGDLRRRLQAAETRRARHQDRRQGGASARWILSSTAKGALPEQLGSAPVDWGSASNAGTIFFIRVNGEPVDFAQLATQPALTDGGFCPIVEPMGEESDPDGGDFTIFGTPTTLADPFAGALGNVCTAGNKTGDLTPFPPKPAPTRPRPTSSWTACRPSAPGRKR